jgi:hypothetical protein
LNLPATPEEQEPKEKEAPPVKAAKEARVFRRAPVSTFAQLTAPKTMSPSESQEAIDDARQDELMRRFFNNERSPNGNAGDPPKIDLSFEPDGRIIIRSDDTRALDLLEELIGQVTPRQPDFRIFHLVHADAYWVMANLEEFFEEKEDKDSSGSGYPSMGR